MHDGASKCGIRARPHHQPEIGLFHRRIVVDVDDDDLRPALLAGLDRMGHDIDLGDDRIGAPDDDTVRHRHLARIRPAQRAGAHHVAGPGHVDADRVEEAGIFLHMPQPLDAVALHQPHRAGVEIGPDRLAAMRRFRLEEGFGDLVQRVVPADLLPGTAALFALAALRRQKPVGMVDALGIAGHLGADDAGRVGIGIAAAHPAEASRGVDIDIEGACGRTVVRTGRMTDAGFGGNGGRNVHGISICQTA